MNFNHNFFSSKRNSLLLLGALLLIVLDFCFYLLSISGYYFTEGATVVYKVVYISHFLYLYILLITVSKTKFSKVFWGAIGPFILIPILLIGGFLFFYIEEENYYSISSPKSTNVLTIRYYNWSLGETNHYYDFYQKTPFPGLQKRINKETLHIMTRNTDANDLDVLGAYKVKWNNEKAVHFISRYKETTIYLK